MKPRACDIKASVRWGSGNERQAIVKASCGGPYTAYVQPLLRPYQDYRGRTGAPLRAVLVAHTKNLIGTLETSKTSPINFPFGYFLNT